MVGTRMFCTLMMLRRRRRVRTIYQMFSRRVPVQYTLMPSVVDPDPHGPELFPGPGSGIKAPDPDPAKSERAYK